MGEIVISSGIFPMIMRIGLGEGKFHRDIELPRGGNLLYLERVVKSKEDIELQLLKKYAHNEDFSNLDYANLFKLFFVDTHRETDIKIESNAIFEKFGVTVKMENENEIKFCLVEELIPRIKAETWECIALDLLKTRYTNIINAFSFGDINIYLGSWKTGVSEQEQDLLSALRMALMFTLIGYLYGDDQHLYQTFDEFFNNEFNKRVALVYGLWKTQELTNSILYIPIYDSFHNLNNVNKHTLINILHAVLNNEELLLDDRMNLKKRLVSGAEVLHRTKSKENIKLEKTLIKPVVNCLMELESAENNIMAAQVLIDTKLNSESINRSYYSMMHSLKALLESKGELADWVENRLNVEESHKSLEDKLKKLSKSKLIDYNLLKDFRYVKQKRWAADYNVSMFNSKEAMNCLEKAKKFINEVKKDTITNTM